MTLIRYELKKLRGARMALLTTAGIVLAGLLYVAWLLTSSSGGTLIQQAQLFQSLSATSLQEMVANAEQLLAEQQEGLRTAPDGTGAAQYAKQVWLCSEIMQDLETVSGYDDLLEQLIQGGGGVGSLMVQSAYRQRDVRAAQAAYERLKGLELSAVFSGGVELLLDQPVLDLGLLLTAAVWVLFLLLSEYDNGTLACTRMTPKGVWPTLCAKWLVLAGILAAAVLALYGGGLAVVCALTGDLSWSAPVQSIPALVRCPFLLSIGQFCLLFAAAKLITVLSCATLFGMLSTLWRSMIPAVLSFGAVFGGEWLLARYISPFSVWGLSARMNLVHTLDSLTLFAQWDTVDLFGWPVLFWYVWLLLLVVLAVACFGGMGHFFSPPHGCEPCVLHGMRQWESVRLRPAQTLFWYEGKKLWWIQSGGLLLCIVTLIQVLSCAQIHRWINAEEAWYASYMTVLSGVPSPEKNEVIAQTGEELTKKEELLALVSEQYSQGAITFEQYSALSQMYTVSDSQKEGWTRAREDYEWTLALREQGIAASCVPQDGWELLFGPGGVAADCLQSLFLIAGLVLGLSGYVTMEHFGGMTPLLGLYPNRQRAERAKHIHAAMFASALAVAAFLPRRLAIMNCYGIGLGAWPVQSLRLLENCPLLFPMWLVFGLRLLLDIVLAVIAGEVMLRLSVKVKNRFAIVLIGSVMLIVPVCVVWSFVTTGK